MKKFILIAGLLLVAPNDLESSSYAEDQNLSYGLVVKNIKCYVRKRGDQTLYHMLEANITNRSDNRLEGILQFDLIDDDGDIIDGGIAELDHEYEGVAISVFQPKSGRRIRTISVTDCTLGKPKFEFKKLEDF